MICKKTRIMTESLFVIQKCGEFVEKLTSQNVCFNISEGGKIESYPILSSASFQTPHLHSSWELKLSADANLLPLPEEKIETPLEVVIIPPETTHSGTMGNLDGEKQMLAITQEHGCLSISYVGKNNYFLVLEQAQFKTLTEFIFASPRKICAAIYSSIQLPDNKSTKSYAINLLRFFLSAIARALTPQENSTVPALLSESDAVVRAIQYITAYYYLPTLTVNEVANYAGITPGHLSVLFKKREKTSVRKLIVKVRLEKAKELLLTGRYIIKEASHLTGWNNQLYFSKCFRKYYGVSPRDTKKIQE